MSRVLVVVGTRPEAIKLAPVVSAMRTDGRLEPVVCATGQHRDVVDLTQMGLWPKHELSVQPGSLGSRAAQTLAGLSDLLAHEPLDAVLVQGDTTTAFAGALAAFYAGIPVGHIEAGLRTGDLAAPWPEEGHRLAIDCLSRWLFAPTPRARDALISEGVGAERIWVVGNTGIDALRAVQPTPEPQAGRSILVTVHRRENHGAPLGDVCLALRQVAARWREVRLLLPVHPNPEVSGPVREALEGIPGIELMPPLDHASMTRALATCTFVMTDSGGLQEEAPYLGKPVLVLREGTERPEGVEAGTARLVGTNPGRILAACAALLDDPAELAAMSAVHHPYGDGHASERIVEILADDLAHAVRAGR